MAITRLNLIRTLCQTPLKRWRPLLLGVRASLAVLLTWQQLTLNGQIHIQQLIQQEANAIQLQLTEELSIRMLTRRQMANRWEANGGTPKALWEADADADVKDFYGYQAIELVDPLFKVRSVVPLAGNEAEKNLDFNQQLRRKIPLQAARDLPQPMLTHNISLLQGGQGFLLSLPLFVVFLGNRFDGFILGVFQCQTLFDSSLKRTMGYKVAIYAGTNLVCAQELLSQELHPQNVVMKAYSAEWRRNVFSTLV